MASDDPVLSEMDHMIDLPKGERFIPLLKDFYQNYFKVQTELGKDPEKTRAFFSRYAKQVAKQLQSPFTFSPLHQKESTPFNFEEMGKAFVYSLIDKKDSYFLGKENALLAEECLKRGGNVVFLANHQIEPDPQVILFFLENDFPLLSNHLTFVAGERVLTDPLAVPFSRGCNILSIYSKRYLDFPPELKEQKRAHNITSMRRLKELFEEGQAAVYVAPSGGRDRKDAEGVVRLSPFDEQSVEIFRLTGLRSKKETLFFPMALLTYDLLPPPEGVQKELGEERRTRFAPVGFGIGAPLQFEEEEGDKVLQRQKRAHRAFHEVEALYRQLETHLHPGER